jgi:hypothetical protein
MLILYCALYNESVVDYLLNYSSSSRIQRILSMVDNTQNHLIYGPFLSSGILITKKITTFRKLNLFPSLREGKETPTLLGPTAPVIEVSSF